jgi:hypothetical protein
MHTAHSTHHTTHNTHRTASGWVYKQKKNGNGGCHIYMGGGGGGFCLLSSLVCFVFCVFDWRPQI